MNKLFALLVGIVLVFSVSLVQAENINGVEIDEPMLAEGAVMSQDVGADMTITRPSSMKLSNPWSGSGGIYSYWYTFTPSYTAYNPKAIIIIRQTGNPFKKILHQWKHPSGYRGGTKTPFAINDWGGANSRGYCKIRVKYWRGSFTSGKTTLYR